MRQIDIYEEGDVVWVNMTKRGGWAQLVKPYIGPAKVIGLSSISTEGMEYKTKTQDTYTIFTSYAVNLPGKEEQVHINDEEIEYLIE